MNKVILTLALAAALFAGDVYAKNDADNFIVTSVYDDKNIYIYFQADKPIVDSAYQFVMDFTKLSKTDGKRLRKRWRSPARCPTPVSRCPRWPNSAPPERGSTG